jgi:hypothetical protein
MAQIKLLSMTAVLTALIWVSADRLVNEDATVEITITPIAASADTGMVVAMSPEHSPTFEVQVSGPRRAIATLQARENLTLRLPVSEYPTGERSIVIDTVLLRGELAQRWSEFARLHVASIDPPGLDVMIDHFVERSVVVEARTLTLAYESDPQIQRVSTVVRLRESVLNSLPDREAIQIDIGPDIERRLRDKPFGRSTTVTVPLDARRFGDGATFIPPARDVTATVRSQQRVEQIPTVPVLVALSFANLDVPFRAVGRDGNPISLVTRTIMVTGPPDAVARLVRGETRAYGIIRIKEDDLREKSQLRMFAPDYHLPPQIELASEPEPVELQLVPSPRTASGS